jgi:uncharacterized protein YozE (UPF0346 family)
MNTFRVWIRQFIGESTPFGDLADDITDDSTFPKKNDHDIILEYLHEQRAIPNAITTFETAWKQYQTKNQ